MKARLIISIFLLFFSVGPAYSEDPAQYHPVSNDAYNATSWNGVSTVAPSKDAVRDKIETLAPAVGASAVACGSAIPVVGNGGGTQNICSASGALSTAAYTSSTAYVPSFVSETPTISGTPGNETIAVSSASVTKIHSTVSNGGAAGNLYSITGGVAGQILVLTSAVAADVITVKAQAGLHLQADFTLGTIYSTLTLECVSSGVWREISRAANIS